MRRFFHFRNTNFFGPLKSADHMLLHLSNITIQDDGILFIEIQQQKQQLQDFHSFLKRNFSGAFFLC